MPTALVVDDNRDVRMLLRFALEPAGYKVLEADSGPGALSLLGSIEPPDVILLDVQMPVMDGWETLQAIRSGQATSSLPVLMCSVKSRPIDLDRGVEFGCDGYLTKPFDVRAVAGDVQSAISSRRQRLATTVK